MKAGLWCSCHCKLQEEGEDSSLPNVAVTVDFLHVMLFSDELHTCVTCCRFALIIVDHLRDLPLAT